MGIACAEEAFRCVFRVGAGHEFQPCPAVEGEEVAPEPGAGVVVGSARPGGKVAGEKGARCFQVVYVEGSVVYLHRASVAGQGQVGVVVVAEHAADLALQIALFGEGRQGVFGKKSASQRVESRPGAAPGEAAEDEKFVGVVQRGRIGVGLLVVHGKEAQGFGVVARFFLYLFPGHLAGRVAHVGPPSGQRPAAVGLFLHEEYLAAGVEDTQRQLAVRRHPVAEGERRQRLAFEPGDVGETGNTV